MWDWDEALFTLGVRDYDVVLHQPHPPGFPLYVFAAKVVHLVVKSEFRSLQAIVFGSAIVLFPLLFWLAREARCTFLTSYLGALLTVFLPNVWIYGGTAFSDVPGLAVTIASCALLLRGARDPRSYYAGAALLGCAAAIRPQALLIGFAPAVIASLHRRWRQFLAATLIGAAVIVVSYAGAAVASESLHAYLRTVGQLRRYLREVDSFLAPGRPPLRELLSQFFVYPIPGPQKLVLALAIASGLGLLLAIVRRTVGPLIIAATFVPFVIFGWLMLDIYSVSRYSVSFAPVFAVLAAEAAVVIGRRAAPLLAAALIVPFAVWTWPSLETVHRSVSPPVEAIDWTSANVPHTATAYFAGNMFPFSSYFDLPQREVAWPSSIPHAPFGKDDVFITEAPSPAVKGRNFYRGRDRLFRTVRQRFFEVSVTPASSVPTFGEGWYEEESWGIDWWKWMGGRSVTYFPAVAGNARLTLNGDIPTELVPRKTTMEVRVNGQAIDRFLCEKEAVEKTWIVPALADRPNEIVIAVDKVINPAKEGINPDGRDLGFRLRTYGWEPAGQ